jgi:hypothetical protein
MSLHHVSIESPRRGHGTLQIHSCPNGNTPEIGASQSLEDNVCFETAGIHSDRSETHAVHRD